MVSEDSNKTKKSVSFTKIPKRKNDPPSITYYGSKAYWPLATRSRLFFPFFSLTKFIKTKPNQNQILGKGHFGTVFAYHDETNNSNNMAIKVLRKSSIIREKAVIQIIQEIRIHSVCSGLQNVLPFLSAWQDSLNLYVATQLCSKGTLAELMIKRDLKPLCSEAILTAAQQLHTGLKAIHNLGVIFRDLKLKNVLISESGNLIISDFGLAKWLNRHQRTHTICGTLAFMAPEVSLNQPYHHSVDLWSLGMVLYGLAFGYLPFAKAKDHEHLAELQNCEMFELKHEDHQVETLLEKLLQKDPDSRTFEDKSNSAIDPFAKLPSFIDLAKLDP